MPLFVPILRLLMLFLNVYDSYKTLKQPPPSSRNGGRPSVRALTQRKRDMKGCLAVWIVWMCLTMYERVIESIISLFIPFYDEFKSLLFVFLILTRARGAEPIYLHVIRPFLKPYTSTLDGALEVALMMGDFIFALTTYPIRMCVNWWHRKFGPAEPLDTETESHTETSTNDAADEPSTSLANQRSAVQFPSKVNGSKQLESRRRSEDSIHRSGYNARSSASQVSLKPVANQNTHSLDTPDAGSGNLQHDEIEEWRKYPAFPAAYPSTPLTTSSRLLPTRSTFSTNLQPPDEDDKPQQDFRQSLMPPREPLNPSYAGDMSDKQHSFSFGIHTPSISLSPPGDHTNFDTEDSLDYNEEEDDFNITLRTPLHPMGSLRAEFPTRRFISQSSDISGISIPSRSSALTTLDLSSLKSDSELGSEPPSAVASNDTDSSSVIGKKRAHVPTHSSSISPRVRQVHAREVVDSQQPPVRTSLRATTSRKTLKPLSATRRRAIILPADDDSEFVSTTTGTDDEGVVLSVDPPGNQPPEEKRRKVSQPSARAPLPARASNVTRPIRQRPIHQTSPTQARRVKSVVVPPKRGITATTKAKAAIDNRSKPERRLRAVPVSASTSSGSLPPLPPKDSSSEVLGGAP